MFQDKNQRTDLFNMWLRESRDWGSVNMRATRSLSQKQQASVQDAMLSRAELEKTRRYTAEDLEELITRLTRQGRYTDDPNFPGIEKYRKYQVVNQLSSTRTQEMETRMEIQSNVQLTADEASNLTSAGATA